MSVVVAIKNGDKVYLGADSQVTRGGTRATLKNPNNYKIWKVKEVDHCLMGHVGLVREANIARISDKLISEYNAYKGHIDYEYVVKKVVPGIISELKNVGYIKDEKYFDRMESQYLFIYKDKVYMINFDGCVLEVDDYIAIGSGEDQAIGSLLSTEGEDPEERIIKAIKASAASDIYVDYPIILTNSDDMNFRIINELEESKYIKSNKNKGDKNND